MDPVVNEHDSGSPIVTPGFVRYTLDDEFGERSIVLNIISTHINNVCIAFG